MAGCFEENNRWQLSWLQPINSSLGAKTDAVTWMHTVQNPGKGVYQMCDKIPEVVHAFRKKSQVVHTILCFIFLLTSFFLICRWGPLSHPSPTPVWIFVQSKQNRHFLRLGGLDKKNSHPLISRLNISIDKRMPIPNFNLLKQISTCWYSGSCLMWSMIMLSLG